MTDDELPAGFYLATKDGQTSGVVEFAAEPGWSPDQRHWRGSSDCRICDPREHGYALTFVCGPDRRAADAGEAIRDIADMLGLETGQDSPGEVVDAVEKALAARPTQPHADAAGAVVTDAMVTAALDSWYGDNAYSTMRDDMRAAIVAALAERGT